MSALFTFELKTNLATNVIEHKIATCLGLELPSYEVDVTPYQPRGTLLCEAGVYSQSNPAQKSRISEVVNYLFSIAEDRRVYYYTWGDRPEEAKDTNFTIEVDDIFERYHPWLRDGAESVELRIPLKAGRQN